LKKQRWAASIFTLKATLSRAAGAHRLPGVARQLEAELFGWNAADFGWGADTIQNILWRLNNGELDGVNPKIIVLLGHQQRWRTVPQGHSSADDAKVTDITKE
jgi:hypothetical protein